MKNKNVITVDMDWLPPKDWLEEWIETRKSILEGLGYEIKDVIKHKSGSGTGWHFWFHLDKDVEKPKEKLKLMWMLGDDETRVKINFQRIERGVENWEKIFSKILGKHDLRSEKCKKCRMAKYVREAVGRKVGLTE